MNINLIFVIIISLSQIKTIEIDKINIISLKPNKTIEYHDIRIKKNSTYSKVCEKVLDSFDFIGKDGMDLYRYCEGKYDLLGINNTLIKKDIPFCFTNLNNFYCKYHIKENPHQQFNHTVNSENLKIILSTILGCIKENLTNHNKTDYNCPSLNNNTFKISNSSLFCKNSLKPNRFGEENDTIIFGYAKIPFYMKEKCENIIDVYNACIDSDNVLFPNSNYMRCFDPRNSIYVSSEIELLTKRESDLCSNFILPSIAWRNFEVSQFNKVAKFHCEGYEKKTFLNYDLFTQQSHIKEKDYKDIIKSLKNDVVKVSIITTKTKELGHLLKSLRTVWASFYPKFTSIYLKKDSIPSSYFVLFTGIKNNMDMLHEYSDEILGLTRTVKFALAEFNHFHNWLLRIFKKSEELMKNMLNNINELYDNINPDPKTLALRIIPSVKEILKFKLTRKELASDQNEFVNMNVNMKAFFKFTKSRSDNNLKRFTDKQNKFNKKLQALLYMRNSIVHQKNHIKKLIFEDV